MLRDLSEVRSVAHHVLDIVRDIKKWNDDRASKQFTGDKLDWELYKYKLFWDEYSAMKLVFDKHQDWLDRPIEEVTTMAFYRIHKDMEELLYKFNNPRLRYQADPEFVAPILLSLSKYVGSLVNTIKTIKTNEWHENVTIYTEVPCKLADTVKAYFEPTLFDLLGKIEVLIPDYGKFSWYSKIHEIFKDPFNPDSHVKNDMKLLNCVTSEQLERIKSSCYPDPGGFCTKVFYDRKSLACSQYFKDLSRVKDESRMESDYYYGDSNGFCVIDYFSLARHKLEVEFGNAYKNVQDLCTDPIDNSTVTLTGNSRINSLEFNIIIIE